LGRQRHGPGGTDLGSPNEFISITDPNGIDSFTVSTPDDSDPNNDPTFTLDNFAFGTPSASSVPDSLDFATVTDTLGCLVGFDYLIRRRRFQLS
jgi:hypothetical protein